MLFSLKSRKFAPFWGGYLAGQVIRRVNSQQNEAKTRMMSELLCRFLLVKLETFGTKLI